MCTTNEEQKIISRAEAIEQQLKHYFTGKPCKHGHIDYRRTNDGGCMACKRVAQKKWNDENPGYRKQYEANNPDYIARHRERCLERGKNDSNYQDTQREYLRKYHRDLRSKKDPRIILRDCAFRWVYRVNKLMETSYSGHPFELFNYSIRQLQQHIESLFTPQMEWSNHGDVWHLDHLISIRTFSELGIDDISQICALENIHPILKSDNNRKHNKDWNEYLFQNPDRAIYYTNRRGISL